jgi:hypothetical protein
MDNTLPSEAWVDELPDRIWSWTMSLADNEAKIAARNLKNWKCGKEAFFARFPDAERIWDATPPRPINLGVAEHLGTDKHLTDEAVARALKAFEDDHLFRLFTGYYEKEQKARDALRKLSPNLPRKDWIRVGIALKHEFGEAGWPMWQAWSAPGKTYDPGDIRYQWDTLPTGGSNPVTIGTIIRLAEEVTRG